MRLSALTPSARLLSSRTPTVRARRLLPPARRWHDVASPGRLGDPEPEAWVPPILRSYLRVLHDRPLTITSATCVATAALGDALAQLTSWSGFDTTLDDFFFNGRRPFGGELYATALRSSEATMQAGVSAELGPMRTVRFAALAGGLAGYAGERWFRSLLGPFPGWTYEVALRTIVDQAFFAPAVLGAVVGGVALLSTRDLDYTRHKLHRDWAHVCGKMWAVWSTMATVNYLLVPTPYQPPCTAALSMLWAAYVSYRAHLPTMRRGFHVDHTPEKVGAYIADAVPGARAGGTGGS